MDFERRAVIISAGLLAVSAGGAVGSWHAGQMGATAACTVLGLAAAAGLGRALSALAPVSRETPLERPYVPAGAEGRLTERMVMLEAQLEFAPVALFGIDGGPLEPLNASARRVLAPGRAVSPDAVRAQLAGLDANARGVIEFDTERGCERALVTKVALTIKGEPRQLVALMPMESELQAEAMQAWEKLVQVLSHEIMNSLTPVASLTQTSRGLLEEAELAGAGLSDEAAADLALALEAIGRRADSLVRFVSGYRALASVPEPVLQPFAIAGMLARLQTLTGPDWTARGGRAEFVVEPASMTLLADAGQLEQALVNLLKNAAEATDGIALPNVSVSARLTRGERLRIEVRDNGPGVPDEIVRQIFTPFFSTKIQGSGIGLAMVRQLVHRNGGTVRYAKSIGAGACFVLTF